MQKIRYYLSLYKKKIVLFSTTILFIIGFLSFILINDRFSAEAIDFNSSENKTIKVDVKGAVEKEGVVEINEGDRVEEAIKKAGGFKPDAYTRNINLARKLKDENVIIVYTHSEVDYYRFSKIPVVCENEDALNTNGICELYSAALLEKQSVTANTSSGSSNTSNACVNINSASIEEITSLEGVGTSKAEKIVEYRNTKGFTKVEDLLNVDGIGEKMYESIKDKVCL